MNAEHEAKQAASTELVHVREEITALDGWVIDDDEGNALAGGMLQDVKQRHKALEAKRKSITTPLLEAKRAVDDLFREPRALLEAAEQSLKSKIAVYVMSQGERNAAHLEAARGAESLEEAAASIALVEHVQAPAGVSVRRVWRPRVINEGLLDQRFTSPDMSKIKAWAKEHVDTAGKPLPIPGVVFDADEIVTSRKAKA